MSKLELWGLIVLGAGAVVGLVSGGPAGLVLAAVCLVVGLVLFVASEAMGTKPKGVNPSTPSSTEPTAPVLVLVKEVHARPQRGNKFQKISDPDQADLEFEVFANCWLVNATDELLGITELKKGGGFDHGSATHSGRLGKLALRQVKGRIGLVGSPVSSCSSGTDVGVGFTRGIARRCC